MMSTVMPDISEQADAPRAGADLMAARERLGRSLPEMAEALRIRLPFLDALERGRLADLPGNAYALAFLRTYATALGLDPVEMTRRFKAEAAAVGRKTELAFPAPLPDRGLPAGALMLVGLLLAVGVYAGWYRLSGEGKLPAETVLPVPARLAALVTRPPAPARPHATAGGIPTAQAAPAGSAAPAPGGPATTAVAAALPAAPAESSAAATLAAAATPADAATPVAAAAPAADAAGPAAAPAAGTAPGPAAGMQLAAVVPSGADVAPPTASPPPPEVSPGSAAAATPTAAQDAAMLGSTQGAPSGAVAQLVVLATADFLGAGARCHRRGGVQPPPARRAELARADTGRPAADDRQCRRHRTGAQRGRGRAAGPDRGGAAQRAAQSAATCGRFPCPRRACPGRARFVRLRFRDRIPVSHRSHGNNLLTLRGVLSFAGGPCRFRPGLPAPAGAPHGPLGRRPGHPGFDECAPRGHSRRAAGTGACRGDA